MKDLLKKLVKKTDEDILKEFHDLVKAGTIVDYAITSKYIAAKENLNSDFIQQDR